MLSRLSPYWLWLVLAIPALTMIPMLTGDDPRAFHTLLHPTGEFAARFLILSMIVTPLMYLTKGAGWVRWMKTNRRYFGMAAFFYAALHTVFYIIDEATLSRILAEATEFDMAMGWLAMVVFIPLAATSFDVAVKRMGRVWKPVQRLTYLAAVATLLHWAALHGWNSLAPALVHFSPLIALTVYRLWWLYLRPRRGDLAAA